jgi:L-histidine Nalpha-methyltransferase
MKGCRAQEMRAALHTAFEAEIRDQMRALTAIVNKAPDARTFLDDVVAGLSQTPKRLPSKYFYDERGSRLFDEICTLEEYYLTRTELTIMQQFAEEIAEALGQGNMLVEYGSGSSLKTRILLDRLQCTVAYVPVDISGEHLEQTAGRLAKAYPHIEILPVCADFTTEFELPRSKCTPSQNLAYFPGSTIGNFKPKDARRLLQRIASVCGSGGGLLIGIDLQKAIQTIEAAYNDRNGVTMAFNRNLLHRINRELDADFRVDAFEHRAIYNEELGRVETYLISDRHQTVTVDGATFRFEVGEAICTEYSHKYTIDGFHAIAATAGFSLERAWSDDQELFAVLHFRLPAIRLNTHKQIDGSTRED